MAHWGGYNRSDGPLGRLTASPAGPSGHGGARRSCRPGSIGLDGSSAFRAEERAAPGGGPPDGVDDVGESHFRDLTRGLDRSVRGASSGLGLDFHGHGLSPVMVGSG